MRQAVLSIFPWARPLDPAESFLRIALMVNDQKLRPLGVGSIDAMYEYTLTVQRRPGTRLAS